MKTYRFGVLGAGNMGMAIAEGAVRAGLLTRDQVLLFNRRVALIFVEFFKESTSSQSDAEYLFNFIIPLR